MTAPGRGRRETIAERRERRAAIDDLSVVLEAGARFLETRSRSVAEVRRRLAAAGYHKPLVEAAIERLVELGFLDDDAFARAWVESRDRVRPRGEQALRRELRLKGVEPAVVDAALARRRGERGERDEDGVPDGIDGLADPDLEAARRLLERRRAALERETDPRRRRQKAYALLARNGFSPDVAARVSAELSANASPDEDDPPPTSGD
ncbi:MAG TPA: regulatory protein RecX [Candidatus Limnocylindrales bacterium]|nr:regulatory protein RecX [Candidatus Limnocylindrales bacterium]